ncbi:MAG: glycosyltransferase family 2 protein [Chloroflexi bacterium]|nr:glycosyltransferase family 2 protein [Chloroflexota bacterium]
MPCLNEAETLGVCIQKAREGAREAGVSDYEILVADNGSSDGSQDAAEKGFARVLSVQDKGYGSALRAGINHSYGKFVIMADADDSYDWSHIKPIVDKLRSGIDLVMGSRLKGTILPDAMPPLHRWLGNPVLTRIGNILFSTHVSDFHCGLRGFSKDAIISLNLQTSGMEFATEMVAKAGKFGLSIEEVPIVYYPDGRSRKPHLRTWQDGWRHLTFMLAVSPNWVFLYPGFILFLCGVLGVGVTMFQPFQIGPITLDVHTLLVSSLLLITGVQLLTFWMIARFYSAQVGILPASNFVTALTGGSFLNFGIFLGLLCMFLGLIPFLTSLSQWVQVDFGPLRYEVTLRLIIPTLTLVIIGMHVFFSSFVIGLMSLGSAGKFLRNI